MKSKSQILKAPWLFALLLIAACTTVPLTGRQQLSLVSASEMQAMSFQQYDQFLSENKLSADESSAEMVQRVGQKIAVAVETYLAEQGLSDHIKGFQWEFNLVEDPSVNAWCMPGGKVVFYTGILPLTQDEDGLAVVMGHEIAHAVARHGGERMSHQLLTQAGGVALAVALDDKPAETQAMALAAFGLGAQVGIMLPYSRQHEYEADHMGLMFMAMAGYDPKAAVAFWERMAAQGGQKPPEFLSTHPVDEKRIAEIKSFLPEAMQYYQQSEQ